MHSFILSNPLLSLLEKCKSMTQVKQIQTQMIITGLILDGLAASRLVAFCAISKSKNLNYCKRILNNLRCPNVFSWNVMIRGYCKSEKPEESLLLYKEMLRRSNVLRPDNHTYPLLLKCCAKLSLIRIGFSVIGHVIHLGFEYDVYVNNAVIHLLVSCGELDEAHRVFSESCVRDLVSWNSIINGYAKSGKPSEALRLYRQMEVEGITPDEVTLIGMVSSCAQLENLNLGRKLHQCIEESRIKMTIPLGNALMDMYVKCGNMDAAESLFDKMTRKTIVSWTTMIVGYGKYGHIDVAKKLFVEMPEKNVVSCNAMIGAYIQAKYFEDALATFHEMQGVLSACCHGGLVNEGHKIFSQMTSIFNIIPKSKHYSCMVDLLGRAGLLKEAEELIKTMPIKADEVVWGALFFACRILGNVEMGERAAFKLLELDPSDSGTYVLLAGMYREAKMFEKSKEVRKLMRVRGVDKTPGCSAVEVNGNVFEFIIRDKSHPQHQEISECLVQLTKQLVCFHDIDSQFLLLSSL